MWTPEGLKPYFAEDLARDARGEHELHSIGAPASDTLDDVGGGFESSAVARTIEVIDHQGGVSRHCLR